MLYLTVAAQSSFMGLLMVIRINSLNATLDSELFNKTEWDTRMKNCIIILANQHIKELGF